MFLFYFLLFVCLYISVFFLPTRWNKDVYIILARGLHVQLDGCIMWNAHNTVLGSKRLDICTSHLTPCRLRWGLTPYRVACWSIQPNGHNRHGPRIGGGSCYAPYGGGAGFPCNTMCLGRGLRQYQRASWSIQPFRHNTHGAKMGAAVPLLRGPHLT